MYLYLYVYICSVYVVSPSIQYIESLRSRSMDWSVPTLYHVSLLGMANSAKNTANQPNSQTQFWDIGNEFPFVTFYNDVLRPLFLPRFSWWCLTSHLSSSCFPFLDAEFHEDLLLFGLGFEEIGIFRSSKWANSCFFCPPSGKIVTGIYRGLSLSSRVGIKNNNHQQMITNVSGKHCRTVLH